MRREILLLVLMSSASGGCHENRKNNKEDFRNANNISGNGKTGETPQFIVNAKDTFFSVHATLSGGEPQYFEDIQSLTGRYKLTGLKYPCIEIRNIANKRLVVYHYDQTDHTTFVYQKIANHWLARYFYSGDTCKYWYTYEYVLPGEAISFTYSNKEATWFSDITVASMNRETIYSPEKGITISPDLFNVPLIKNNYNYIHERVLIEKDDLVKVQTIRTKKDGAVVVDITDCFSSASKKYSLNWWTAFGWNMNKKTGCK